MIFRWIGTNCIAIVAAVCVGWMLFSYCAPICPAQDQPQPVKLTVQNRLTKQLPAEASHSYFVTLEAAQFARLQVEYLGGKAEITIYDPTGQQLKQVRWQNYSAVSISFIAPSKGDYQVNIRATEKPKISMQYQIEVAEIRKATKSDQMRIRAEQAFYEGEKFRWTQRADDIQIAIKKYEEAGAFWRLVKNQRSEAIALRSIGELYELIGETQQALSYYFKALALNKNSDAIGEADSLNKIGYVYVYSGEKQKAEQTLSRALSISQTNGYQQGKAQALNNLGEYNYFYGNYEKSIELYNQGLQISQEINAPRLEAYSFLNLSETYSTLADREKALRNYQQSLSLWRLMEDSRGEALAELAGAGIHAKWGDNQQAIFLYNEALKKMQRVGDKLWEAVSYNGLGFIYSKIGDINKAIEYRLQALKIIRRLRLPLVITSTLLDLGKMYQASGDSKNALRCFQEIQQDKNNLVAQQIAASLTYNIGLALESLGNQDEALAHYTKSLTLNPTLGLRKNVFGSIGKWHFNKGEKQKALENFTKALQINREVHDEIGEVSALYYLALTERDLWQAVEAQKHIEEAIRLAESLRENVKGPEFRTTYFATVQNCFDLYIDLLMQQHKKNSNLGFDIQALELSERARARTFLESLLESNFDIGKGVDPSLLTREKELKQKIDERSNYREQLLAKSHTESQLQTVDAEINELTAEFERLRSLIRAANPNYSSLTIVHPIKLQEIQALLDSDTALLEYRLGDERSYLWAVSQNAVESFELPSRQVIESLCKSVLERLVSPSDAAPLTGKQSRQMHTERATSRAAQATEDLSRLLLGAVAPLVKSKRLLIVADGALQYIPFAALYAPNRFEPETPLLVEHEIINLPSASVLTVLRKEFNGRALAEKSIAVIADPVFTKEDFLLKRKNRSFENIALNKALNVDLQRAVTEANRQTKGREIGRLPYSLIEADNILQIATGTQTLRAVGFDANLEKVKSADLRNYRYIHFATHGLTNENPYLSGIVLSLIDERGQPQRGFLRLQDISDLKLSSELVVLSACQTALGREFRGEGLISLTRGFMQAGSKRVIASLWNVNDSVTADLMKQFYQGLFIGKLSPAAALRAAQLEVWKRKSKKAPYYWAAFILQGEWQ
jgi:CHAT domain-containing protein/Flp pilus assembly protein TadD